MSVTPSVRTIRSAQNRSYRRWRDFAAHPESVECPWVAVQNWKHIHDLVNKHTLQLLLLETLEDSRLGSLLECANEVICLPDRLLENLSTLSSSQGVIAFFEKPLWNWKHLSSYVLYLDRLQDPGNLGTLLRTAQATGIFSLVTSPGTVSCFNTKVVRASAGALYSVPFLEEIPAQELADHGYRLWAADTGTGQSLFDVKFNPPLAILLGNEGMGLESTISSLSQDQVKIPMQPEIESLNAAVAGSLILYEVFRQTVQNG